MIRHGVLLFSLLGLSADSVTLGLAQYFDVRNAPVLVFSGTISSRAGGEYVEVLGRECRSRGERLISGVLTSAGGGWRVENPDSRVYPPRLTLVYSGMTFRARWHGQYSRPVVWRLPAGPRVARIGRTRTWVVHVAPANPTGRVGFQGKIVVLQRKGEAGRWVRVRTARLAHKTSLRWGVYDYQAAFTVPTRNLRLRAFLPAKSAAPCFLPGSSPEWVS